jgi:uracil-DNA glycosylase family 4
MDARRTRALKQRLESLSDAGVSSLPRSRATRKTVPAASASAATVPSAAGIRAPASTAQGSAQSHAQADRIRSLTILRQQVVDCTRCTELAATRTQTVFGVGPPDARLCFFGEAPGADEDASGEPFVGRAGQLLTKIIEACTLTREQVYILNVLKCRPPGNRPPQPDEVANCRGFFEQQFEAIAPEFICCLGTSAAQALLKTTEPIGKLRGRWFKYGTAQVLCTYHPSYLLRNPAAKRDVWDDMKILMQRMGVQV